MCSHPHDSCSDLGIYTVYRDAFDELEVIATSQLAAGVALIPATSRRLRSAKPLWIMHSFDRVRVMVDLLPSKQSKNWRKKTMMNKD